MVAFTKQVLVDWDNDGTADAADPYEDVTADLRQLIPVRMRSGRDQYRELSPPRAGDLSFTLDNQSGRYSSDNSSSPIFGQVLPGRRVVTKASYGGTDYPFFAGRLQLPEERPLRQDRNVGMSAVDALGAFNALEIDTAMHTNVRIDEAIGHALDAMGWPAGKRILDTAATTLPRWWVSGIRGFQALRDLVLTEGPPSALYVDGDENVVFEGRHYRWLTSRCTSSQATLRDTGTEPCYSRYDYRPGLENVINSVTVKVRSFASAAGQALQVAGQSLPLTIPPGDTAKFTVSTDADGFSGAAESVTVSSGSVAASWNRTSGKRAVLTLTNSGASSAVVTAVSATATTWTISTQDVSNTIDASASIAKYGTRTLLSDLQPLWLPSVNDALDYCNYLVGRYSERVPQLLVSLNNATEARLLQAFGRKMSDRVTAVESSTGGSADYFVETIERSFLSGGNFEASFGMEKASAQAFWILGIAGYSELGLTTRLGY